MALDVVWGLVAGFVAALVMAVPMLPMMRMGPGFIAMFAARVMSGDPTDRRSMMGGMVFHLIYGTVMGGIFAAGSTYIITFVNPLVNGILFSLLLFIIMMAVVMPIARAPRPPMMMVAVILIVHLIYGSILGSLAAWLSGVAIV